jgi:two-component system LytT family response regulator
MTEETIDQILAAKSFAKDDFVLLCASARTAITRVSDIIMLESSENYTNVYLVNGNRVMIRKSLSECEGALDASIFIRTGRSCIVNLNFVKKVEAADAKRLAFILRDDKHVVLSRKQSIRFRREKSL